MAAAQQAVGRRPGDGVDARDGHDAAATPGLHEGHGPLDGMEEAGDGDGEGPLDVVGGLFQQRLEAGRGGVGHQDVQATGTVGLDPVEEGVDGADVAGVQRLDVGPAAGLGDGRGHVGGRFGLLAVGDDHLGTHRRQALGGGRAQPPGRAGDQGDAPGQVDAGPQVGGISH